MDHLCARWIFVVCLVACGDDIEPAPDVGADAADVDGSNHPRDAGEDAFLDAARDSVVHDGGADAPQRDGSEPDAGGFLRPSDCVDAVEDLGLSRDGSEPAGARFAVALESDGECFYFPAGEYNMEGLPSGTRVHRRLVITGDPGETTFLSESGGWFRLAEGADFTWHGIHMVGIGPEARGAFLSLPIDVTFEVARVRLLASTFRDFQNIFNYIAAFRLNEGGLIREFVVRDVSFQDVQVGINLLGVPVGWSDIDGLTIDGALTAGLQISATLRSHQARYGGGHWRNIDVQNIRCEGLRECRGVGVGGRNMLLEHIRIDGTSMSGTGPNHEPFYTGVGPYPDDESTDITLTVRDLWLSNGEGNGSLTCKGNRQNHTDPAGNCNGEPNICEVGALKFHAGPALIEDFEIVWDYDDMDDTVPASRTLNSMVWQQCESMTFRNGRIRNISPDPMRRAIAQIGTPEVVGEVRVENVVFEAPNGGDIAVRVTNPGAGTVTGCSAEPPGSWERPVRGTDVVESMNSW